MIVSLIAAMGLNHVIGDEKGIPWRMPRDLRRFRELTMGKPILMGRKTAAHLGKPLPGRSNIVLTRRPSLGAEWITAAGVEQALEAAQGAAEAMVIGGGEIYRLFLPLASRVYLTVIEGEFAGTALFPFDEMMQRDWVTLREERHLPDERNAWSEWFRVLEWKG